MGSDSLTNVGQGGGGATISAVHPDILQTHILTRLDGPTLASAACASSQLHALSAEEKLWRDICHHTWPSTADPRVRHLISTFPAGHRSFYSDSFPSLDHRRRLQTNRHHPLPASKLISAVDIRYKNRLILSKVHEEDTAAEALLCSPFRVDILDPRETVPMPVRSDIKGDKCGSDLEENLTLSWILIDTTQNRAANVASTKPVSVDWNWLTGDIELRYVTVHGGNRRGELVQCGVVVTCGGRERGELQVREVSLQMEDMEGKNLNWKESLVVLQEAMVSGKRRKWKKGEEKETYEGYLKLKREIREREKRRERRLELMCIYTSFTIFLTFLVFVTFKFLQLLHLY